MANDVHVIEGPGPSVPVLFLDGTFNEFQAKAQGKRLVSFLAAQGNRRVSLTLGGAHGRWSSPVTGAFGGLAANGLPSASAVFSVVEAATAWLRREPSATLATFRLPPDVFEDPCAAALENALFRMGWRLAEADVNHHLRVVVPEAHFAALNETKRKEIRRLERSGGIVRQVESAAARAVYEVIAENRAAMGFPMTMSWSQVEALADAFPDRVQFFETRRDQSILAGAICLRITDTYLYVFYWGERPEFRKESPVTLLATGLIAYAVRNGVSVLDIGVSTDRSTPNPGLIAFKESLGCRASTRRTYALDLV